MRLKSELFFNKKVFISLLFIIALLPLLDLFNLGLPITHDGPDHVARIANFYQSLTEGHVVPRWAGNLNWGYGHPILMFLYPLPSYIASFFHFVGFSFVDSTKLVFGATYILSIYFMYLLAKAHLGWQAGIVSGILYGFAPYRFVDIYVRGAIGEHVSFVFIPMVCYFLFLLAEGYSKDNRVLQKQNNIGVGISLSMTGLILSHNAVSIMFLPIIGLYTLYLYYFYAGRNNKYLLYALISLMLGFGMSAFFWIPAFFEGKYTLRDIVTKSDFGSRFVPLKNFFFSKWSYGGDRELSKEIGILQWAGILGSVWIMLKEKSQKHIWFLRISLSVFIISLFLMTQFSSQIWKAVSILQKFQFPWRFLHVTVFISALLGGFVVYYIPEKHKKTAVTACFILAVLFSRYMWRAQSYLYYPDSYYSGIYKGTTDTGESSPIWSVRFMEKNPDSHIQIIEGDGRVIERRRLSTFHEFEIKAETPLRVAENTLYFPGWRVYIDNVEKKDIEFQDPNWRGLITIDIERGSHEVKLVFTETKLRRVSDYISVIGFLLIPFIIFYDKKLFFRKKAS